MEPSEIAKYGLMQVTALVYAILVSGAAVKFSQWKLDNGYPTPHEMPTSYYWALFLRDHGVLLFPLIILWAVWVGYYTVIKSEDEAPWWIRAALSLCALFLSAAPSLPW
jgi:hypothetical protein